MTIFIGSLRATAVAVALTFASVGTSFAQDTLEEIVKKAGEEGSVAINVSTTRFPASAGPELSKAISAKFGIDLTVELVNNSPVPVMAGQVIQETNANIKPSFDVFPLPLSFTKAIGEGGAIESIDWAGIGVEPELIDPDGNAVWIDTVPRTIFYNTDLVKGDDIPTSIEDLLDPKWKGQIAGPGFGDAYAMISAPVLGEEKAAQWLESLYTDQELTVIRSISEVPNRVANGEFAFGMGVPANRTGLVTKGAPIANAPLEKVGGQPYYMFVLKDAPNRNAGALLVYFLCCSEEGKKALNDNMGWARFDYAGSEQNAIGGEGRGITPTAEWQLNEQTRVATAFDKVIGQ